MPDLPLRASGDDRCPGALRLHAADDGYVARIRVPGGRLTAAQLGALADLSDDLGDGVLHLTSRGNLQVRGLSAADGAAVATRLSTAGLLPSLAHDRVRNIVASPYGGVPVDGALAALDAALVADSRLAGLSGRFLFGLDDGSGDVLALSPDLTAVLLPAASPAEVAGFVPRGGAVRAPRWQLVVDGHPLEQYGDAAALLIDAALAFLDLRDAHAPTAWRIRDLEPSVRARLVPAPTSPATSNGEPCRFGGRTAPPRGTSPATSAGRGGAEAWVPLGAATAASWRAVATLADRLVLTPWRSVVLPEPHDPDQARIALQATGFSLDPTSDTARTTACIGAPGCAKSLADVRADAAGLAAGHPGRTLHVSGCERRCGHPTGSHLEAVASATGYVIQER